MVGAVVSRTVTVKLLDALFPRVSLAEQVTVVLVIAKVLPEAGAQLTAGLAGLASVALAAKVTAAPVGPVASAVMFAGTVIIGAVVSTVQV